MTASAVAGGGSREPIKCGDGGVDEMCSSLSGLSDSALLTVAGPLLSAATDLAPDACLDGIEAVHLLLRRLEGARLHGARELAARTGEELLSRHDVADPEELSRTTRDRWRARTKSVTAAEICALTGMGRGAARQLVAISLAPTSTSGPVRDSLAAGVATWGQVEMFWRKASQLPHERAGDVAHSLFTTAARAKTSGVAAERLDVHGKVVDTPWGAKQFVQALQREVARATAADPAADAAARAERHRARTAYGIVDDDGSGQVVITGDALGTAACVDRLFVLAKRARAAGDQRKEAQLRSDLARALLLHGTLPLPGLSDHLSSTERGGDGEPDASELASHVTPDDIASLAQIISGTPRYELQVVVPWEAVTPEPPGSAEESPGCAEGSLGGAEGSLGAGQGTPGTTAALSGSPAGGTPSGGAPPRSPVSGPPEGQSTDMLTAGGRGVGRVLGRFAHFLTPGAIRELVCAPGTTMYRLLMDPADGRCIERSVLRYQPDAAMRAQVRAADLLSRAPDGTLPVRDGQLDHVTEYLLGGPTSETNLQGLDDAVHALKTEKFWDAAMDASRNVTWTTLFGRRYRTRPHDYRQYLGLGERTSVLGDAAGGGTAEWAEIGSAERAVGATTEQTSGGASPAVEPSRTGPDSEVDLTPDARRHLASFLVYAALAQRQRGERLEAADDDPDADVHLLDGGHRVMWVRQTRERDGRRVTGPHPGTPTPEEMLATSPQAVLRSDHWTDPFTSARRERTARTSARSARDGGEGPRSAGDGRTWSADEQPPF